MLHPPKRRAATPGPLHYCSNRPIPTGTTADIQEQDTIRHRRPLGKQESTAPGREIGFVFRRRFQGEPAITLAPHTSCHRTSPERIGFVLQTRSQATAHIGLKSPRGICSVHGELASFCRIGRKSPSAPSRRRPRSHTLDKLALFCRIDDRPATAPTQGRSHGAPPAGGEMETMECWNRESPGRPDGTRRFSTPTRSTEIFASRVTTEPSRLAMIHKLHAYHTTAGRSSKAKSWFFGDFLWRRCPTVTPRWADGCVVLLAGLPLPPSVMNPSFRFCGSQVTRARHACHAAGPMRRMRGAWRQCPRSSAHLPFIWVCLFFVIPLVSEGLRFAPCGLPAGIAGRPDGGAEAVIRGKPWSCSGHVGCAVHTDPPASILPRPSPVGMRSQGDRRYRCA